MRRMLVVLHNNLEVGGIEAYLLNALAELGRRELQIDILVPGKIIARGTASKFEELGCTIYEQLISGGKIRMAWGLAAKLNAFLKVHRYDIVYVNVGNIVRQAITLFISKKRGIKTRVAHSHSASFADNPIEKLFYHFLQWMIVGDATHLAACSMAAAVYQFGEAAAARAVIIRNGIDLEKFRFQADQRMELRKKLALEGSFVIGHVGRFSMEKNHGFLIDIFQKTAKRNPSARLLLVGGGELEEAVCAKVDSYGLRDQVIFAGTTDRVGDYMCAMDIFVLPSLFEGFPVTGVEAQASGLPCIFSDTITKEAGLRQNVKFLPLDSGVDVWSAEILKHSPSQNRMVRESAWEEIRAKGYDVKETAQVLHDIFKMREQ